MWLLIEDRIEQMYPGVKKGRYRQAAARILRNTGPSTKVPKAMINQDQTQPSTNPDKIQEGHTYNWIRRHLCRKGWRKRRCDWAIMFTSRTNTVL
jgi:hypothetical protein